MSSGAFVTLTPGNDPAGALQRLTLFLANMHGPVILQQHPLLRQVMGDIEVLLERLADVCPDHQACSICEAPLCETCQLGEFAECERPLDLEDHCYDCTDQCDDCQRARAMEARVDRHWRTV